MDKEIKNVLFDLLKIPSVSDDVDALYGIIDYVENYFSDIDVIIYRYEFNNKPSIVIQNFEGYESDIMFNGHLDVVPSSDIDQFDPIERDGKIYARGAGDMKAGVAIEMVLFKELLLSGYSDKKLSLMITTDEEIGGFDGVGQLVDMGYTSRVVIIPDGGSIDEVVVSQKGMIRLEVAISGRGSHGSRPWLGDSAIDKAWALYEDLKSEFEDEIKLTPPTYWGSTVAMTIFHAGETKNAIPDNSRLGFDIRLTDTHVDMTKNLEIINKLIDKYDGSIVDYFSGKIFTVDRGCPELSRFIDIASEILQKPIKPINEHGASDGRFFDKKKTSVIIHRPTCGNIHSTGEYVEIEAINQAYEIYKKFILN